MGSSSADSNDDRVEEDGSSSPSADVSMICFADVALFPWSFRVELPKGIRPAASVSDSF